MLFCFINPGAKSISSHSVGDFSENLKSLSLSLDFFFLINCSIVLTASIASPNGWRINSGGIMVKKEATQAGAAAAEMDEKLKALEVARLQIEKQFLS